MPEGPKILIVEDDHFLAFLLRAKLEKEKFAVRHVTDGEEALKLIKSEIPDLIVLDLIMPRLSGFELLEIISIDPQYNKIPIIILTNLGQDEDIEKAKRLGAVQYFVKARTSIDELVAAIKSYLKAGTGNYVGNRV